MPLCCTTPEVTRYSFEVAVIEIPINSGPSVIIAQNTKIRCTQGRAFFTRQIWLKARSIMFIIAIEVINKNTAPIEDKPVARLAKLVK